MVSNTSAFHCSYRVNSVNTVDGHNAFAAFKHYISTCSIVLSSARGRDLNGIVFLCVGGGRFKFVLSILKVSLMT